MPKNAERELGPGMVCIMCKMPLLRLVEPQTDLPQYKYMCDACISKVSQDVDNMLVRKGKRKPGSV
jgi:hypothetical protein